MANQIKIEFQSGLVLPLIHAAPFEIKQTRGLDPYMFNVLLTEDQAQGVKGVVGTDGAKASFNFSTPNSDASANVGYKWESLYLVRLEPSRSEEKMWVATFADERWRAMYKRAHIAFNLRWPDGRYRPDTLYQGEQSGPVTGPGTGSPYTIMQALLEALFRFGYPDVINKLDSSVNLWRTFRSLPDNLGNSRAGGFPGSTFSEVMGPLLEIAKCDITFESGKPKLIERIGYGKVIQTLRSMPRMVDTVGTGKNEFEKPREVRVYFEVKLELALEHTAFATGTTSGTDGSFFGDPDNIMLRYERDGDVWWGNEIGEEVVGSQWNTIQAEMADAGYASISSSSKVADAVISKNWFLPNIIPIPRDANGFPSDNAEELNKKLWFDGALRQAWRRLWRIRFPDDNDNKNHLRIMSGLKFGRLNPDGSVKTRGNVYCDWSTINFIPIELASFGTVDGVVSRNFPFDPTQPSPFTAEWVSEGDGELIFVLRPPQGTQRYGEVHPALFERPLGDGAWLNAVGDGEIPDVEDLVPFQKNLFNFRIYTTATLASPPNRVPGAPGNMEGRLYYIDFPLFRDGQISRIDHKIDDKTANFVYSKSQEEQPVGFLKNAFPDTLINGIDLIQTAQRVQQQYINEFTLGNAGGIRTIGIEAASQVRTEDEISEFSIVVGDPDPWSIHCQYIVMPNSSTMNIPLDEMDGAPTTQIDYS